MMRMDWVSGLRGLAMLRAGDHRRSADATGVGEDDVGDEEA